jgi:predicted metal-dependent hydrolase
VTAGGAAPAAVRRGGRLFNLGRYLAAQQVWEEAWRAAEPEERAFLEALVQLAAGLHLRTRRGATRGAVHLLSQALVLLEDYRPATHGVDVEALVAEVDAYLAWLRPLARPHRLLDRRRIPAIRWR